MKIACIGTGRMGRAVAALAGERGHTITATISREENAGGAGISREALGSPDVAIEFTTPEAALANVLACVEQGIPVVTGSTGWYANLPTVIATVERTGGQVFWAPNFSIGVQIFLAAVRQLGEATRRAQGFAAHIVETHHAAKKDAPSGTALAVAGAFAATQGEAPPITSVRVGSVPGTHVLTLDGMFEQITLGHEARDRRVFADGAIRAAEWLVAEPRVGVFTMHDMLTLSGLENA